MRFIAIVFFFLCCTVSSSGAAAVTFSSTAPITINDNAVATPYPSNIVVTGVPGVTKVTVTFTGLTHTFPADIDMLLRAPDGTTSVIFSDVGGATAVSALTVTLDDAAVTALPNGTALATGTYQPADYTPADTFPSPAPAGPYTGSPLSVFNGINPNGNWRLYVVDDSGYDSGTISGGWSISITPPAPPANDAFAAATVITGATATVSGQTTSGATLETGEPTHSTYTSAQSVWYKWIAPTTVQTVVEIAPGTNSFDTLLTVYAGTTLGGLTEIAFNDDAPSHGAGSGVIFAANAGTTYYFRIAGYSANEFGNFDLALHAPTTPVITSPSGPITLHHQQVLEAVSGYVYIIADNFPVSYGASGLPPGLTLDPVTGHITGTATTVGSYPVTFSATNSAGTGTGTITITVDDRPLMTSTANVTEVVGVPLTFTITALNGPITSFGATPLPPGLTLDAATGVVSGTPSTTGQTFSMITITNAAGASTYTLDWTINPTTAPVVNGASTVTAYVGVPFSYAITATNAPLGYSTSPLPPGLTVDITTGVISGTPTLAGTFHVFLLASNGSGNGAMPLIITVTQPPAHHASSKKGCGHGILGAVLLIGLAAFARSRRI